MNGGRVGEESQRSGQKQKEKESDEEQGKRNGGEGIETKYNMALYPIYENRH